MQQKIKNATKNTLREVRSFFAQAVSFGDEEGFRNIYGATSCGNFGYDHITVKIRHPVRSVKSSTVEPVQYLDGGPPGNSRCRTRFISKFLFIFLHQLYLRYLQYLSRVKVPPLLFFVAFFDNTATLSYAMNTKNGFDCPHFLTRDDACGESKKDKHGEHDRSERLVLQQ